uniref:Uncharacterized protein n=1 Tax=Chenopodium quinoa TaxID=63459 RepID=A0A803KVH5_CHEQI
MNTLIILPNSLSSSSPIFDFPNPKPNFSPKLPSISSNFHLFRSLLLHQNPFLKMNRAISLNNSVNASEDEFCGDDLVIEASLTRILPPALTLEHGVVALKDALQEFKLNPPNSASGLIRFQVAVPPSANALDWFCCQPEASGVFPQFYLSKQSKNPTCESAFFSKTHGVFGIGAAVSFRQSPSRSDEWNSFRR